VSFSKRILFGDDPADDPLRQRLADLMRDRLEHFQFKVPLRKRNRIGPGPHWDPFWRSSVQMATAELKIETVNINDQTCTKTKAEADAIKLRAETIHQAKVRAFRASLTQTS
jgi:hypothetical protein